MEHGAWSMEHGAWSMEHGAWSGDDEANTHDIERMSLFRFEELEIWTRAITLGGELCVLAEKLDEVKKWRFAEQLRSAALSISNNIAEGSGSSSTKDFANFLNIAKRSVFENANMMFFFSINSHLPDALTMPLVPKLNELSRMIEAFRQHLIK